MQTQNDRTSQNTKEHDIAKLNSAITRVCDDLDENKKSLSQVEDAAADIYQIRQDRRMILSEIQYYWQGSRASMLISEAEHENEIAYHQVMNALDDKRMELTEQRKELDAKEAELRSERRKLW